MIFLCLYYLLKWCNVAAFPYRRKHTNSEWRKLKTGTKHSNTLYAASSRRSPFFQFPPNLIIGASLRQIKMIAAYKHKFGYQGFKKITALEKWYFLCKNSDSVRAVGRIWVWEQLQRFSTNIAGTSYVSETLECFKFIYLLLKIKF